MGKLSSLILNSDQVKKKLERIAFQIIEEYHNEKELFIVGISNNGFLLAKKLKDLIEKNKLISEVILIELKINKKQPLDNKVVLNPKTSFNNKKIILIDDVLNSGKTLMHAAAFLLGQDIKKMNTVVLVDRRHRNFPIKADWVGLTLSTTVQEHINVEISKDEISVLLE
jgi:pyrimidine operon attenuation protein/uracil phosphoribosyltransferase